MARDLGFWQDMDGYYSNPPDLLVLMHLNGSTSEIRNHFEAAADLAAKRECSSGAASPKMQSLDFFCSDMCPGKKWHWLLN